MKLKRLGSYIANLVVPSILLGFLVGTLTSLTVILFKLGAGYIISLSESCYGVLRRLPYLIPVALVVFFLASLLIHHVNKRIPNIRGGGIPTSVGILRGLITFKWLRTLISVTFMSMVSFLVGVPLGNEGPSVQIGTSIGRGTTEIFYRKRRAWDRYSMTGGACAGFSVATGAPISGILFAVEEAHQRISPTIMMVAASSVIFGNITSELLSPHLGVSTRLFDLSGLEALELSQLWIPVVVGLAVGIFGVGLLKYYGLLSTLFKKKLSKVPGFIKIFIVLTLTLLAGVFTFSSVSTGHHLIESLLYSNPSIVLLIVLLIVRTTLTLSANANGITGGMFLPTLAIGALVASIIGKVLVALGLESSLMTIIVVLGMVACLSGVVKTPLTAIVFAVEALSCWDNIIPVIIVSLVAYLVSEAFGTKSINDRAMEERIEELNQGKVAEIVNEKLEIKEGAFAVGKQIRDIFWPANLFVLSVKKAESRSAEVDGHGGKEISAGDILTIQYSTTDIEQTRKELDAIAGAQAREV
ncbi:MAG: chloride channel protein [Clostridia bacterium]|nr:chloride channel protein [Clostridia bacterium]